MQRRRPKHPRGSIVAYIAVGVLLAASLVALFFQDDDPNTDDAAGAGVLAFIAGLVLIVAYLAIAKWLNARAALAAPDEDGEVPAIPDTRMWVRRNLGVVSAAVAAVVVLIVASTLAPSPETAVRTDPEPEAVLDKTFDKIDLVEKAAAKRTAYGHVSGVFCELNRHCVVTFLLDNSPTCQVWAVRSANGVPVAMPAGEPYYPADPDARGCD